MAYKTQNKYKEEQHPWKPYIKDGADKIILGTFTTADRNRGVIDFYYPNPNNQFWNVLRAVDKENTDLDRNIILSKKQRIELLDRLNLGIADMGFKILRHQNSSLDSSLFVTEFADIFQLIDNHRNVRKLIFCSSSGSNSVEGWFRSYCKLNNIKFPKLKGTNPKRTQFKFGDREIEIVTVHSTSKAAAKGFEELVEMYKNEIRT